MELAKRVYVERIAADAREAILQKGIIEKRDRSLSMSQVEKIIDIFDGKLILLPEDSAVDSPYIEKTEKSAFAIYYKSTDNFMDILLELGHAFLDLDGMKIGDKLYRNSTAISGLYAALFARALIMPRDCFEAAVIDHLCNGECDVKKVADEYKIEYLDVIIRGKELNIWE